jgi:hypothetical protein
LSAPAVSGAAASASAALPEKRRSTLLILASRWFSDWRHPLLIVKPETVLGWQRAGWRAYWRWRSSGQAKGGRPTIRGEFQALIGRMASENRLWGQRRIRAELARLGFSGFRKDRGQIYARAPRPGPNRGVARVPDAACNGHVGLRLFLRPDGPVADALRLLRPSDSLVERFSTLK